MNFSQQKTGRIGLQYSRRQKVPCLVSVNSKETRNRLLLQARNHIDSNKRCRIDSRQSMNQQSCKKKRDENQDMKTMLKELAKQLQKLNSVNEGLVIRIRQVETAYNNLKSHLQFTYEEQKQNFKIQIYRQVQTYVKRVVEQITQDLKQEKMAQSLQDKLEKFMIQLIDINPVSVEQSARIEVLEDYKFQNSARISNQRADKYLTELSSSKRNMPTKEHYSSIMKRLNGQDQMTNSNVQVSRFTSASQDSRLRTNLVGTPQKRRRIF